MLVILLLVTRSDQMFMNYVGEMQIILSTTYGKEMNYIGFGVRPYLQHHLWDRDRAGGVVQLAGGL
jgi:hypothetical protein